jgi:hypothetical protein
MKNFFALLKRLFQCPQLYIYWSISLIGVVAAYHNKGANGSPVLGATSILATLLGLGLFYWHLNSERNREGFPKRRNAAGFFFSFFAFRFRLLLAFLPIMGLLYWTGYLGRISDEYMALVMAEPAAQFAQKLGSLLRLWPVTLSLLLLVFCDQAGRSLVTVQGAGKKALRRLVPAAKSLWLPLCFYVAAIFALNLVNEYFACWEEWAPWGKAVTPSLVAYGLLLPVKYSVELAATLYMAAKIDSNFSFSPELKK